MRWPRAAAPSRCRGTRPAGMPRCSSPIMEALTAARPGRTRCADKGALLTREARALPKARVRLPDPRQGGPGSGQAQTRGRRRARVLLRPRLPRQAHRRRAGLRVLQAIEGTNHPPRTNPPSSTQQPFSSTQSSPGPLKRRTPVTRRQRRPFLWFPLVGHVGRPSHFSAASASSPPNDVSSCSTISACFFSLRVTLTANTAAEATMIARGT